MKFKNFWQPFAATLEKKSFLLLTLEDKNHSVHVKLDFH